MNKENWMRIHSSRILSVDVIIERVELLNPKEIFDNPGDDTLRALARTNQDIFMRFRR
jgi:hypothetical protein